MRKLTSILTLIMSGISFLSCSCERLSNNPDNPSEKYYFEDHFTSFNGNVWSKEVHNAGWTNEELQAYDVSHVSVGKDNDKSVLILTAERRGGKFYSGRVNSKGKKSFKYRKIEASIKLPKTANGLWPAFWLMGENKEWPACGEIDIMEMGEMGGISSGNQETQVNTAIHYGADVAKHQQQYYTNNVAKSLQDGEYHIYTLDWNENSLTISIDGKKFHSFDIKNNTYFHDEFFILFNLAVGGAFTGITDADKISALKEGEKVSMFIDWVRVY